ncbi:MAG: TlpA family protein disulfide reductase [Gammaproteobacteria bacterium]|nr:TlpA family protein disulfide reductase [Gammaproteobacteria bacterium]
MEETREYVRTPTQVCKASLLAATLLLSLSAYPTAGQDFDFIPVEQKALAPDFELSSAEGKSYILSRLRGKVVIVNFWATWCPPCRREMPSMQRARDQLDREDFEILAVNVGESAQAVSQFYNEFDPTLEFPLLLDPESKVVREWSVMGLPTTFVLDQTGQIVYIATGPTDLDTEETIRRLRTLVVGTTLNSRSRAH